MICGLVILFWLFGLGYSSKGGYSQIIYVNFVDYKLRGRGNGPHSKPLNRTWIT